MSLRLPQSLGSSFSFETGASALEQELAAEKAASLGRMGKRVEAALGALRDFDGAPEARPLYVRAAADAVWEFFVQRELVGLGDEAAVIRDYAIPREVLVRLGER